VVRLSSALCYELQLSPAELGAGCFICRWSVTGSRPASYLDVLVGRLFNVKICNKQKAPTNSFIKYKRYLIVNSVIILY
jgi:hypothetical protein